MKEFTLFLISFALIGALIYVAGQFPSSNTAIKDKDLLKIQVLNETFRLISLSNRRNLTFNDLSLLDNLTLNDKNLRKEFLELSWMLSNDFQKHAFHSLTSIHDIIVNLSFSCPAHSFSHVGLYLQYGEFNLADESFNEGKNDLPDWENKTTFLKQKNKLLYPNLSEMLRVMHSLIIDYGKQDYSLVINESKYLDENVYC